MEDSVAEDPIARLTRWKERVLRVLDTCHDYDYEKSVAENDLGALLARLAAAEAERDEAILLQQREAQLREQAEIQRQDALAERDTARAEAARLRNALIDARDRAEGEKSVPAMASALANIAFHASRALAAAPEPAASLHDAVLEKGEPEPSRLALSPEDWERIKNAPEPAVQEEGKDG